MFDDKRKKKKIQENDPRLFNNPPWKDNSLSSREKALAIKKLFPECAVREICKATKWHGYKYWILSDKIRNKTAQLVKDIYKEKKDYLRQAKIDLGGCQICGYMKSFSALEFHHLDPAEKEGKVSGQSSMALIKEEMKKCILLCSNCHREVHDGITEVPTPQSDVIAYAKKPFLSKSPRAV